MLLDVMEGVTSRGAPVGATYGRQVDIDLLDALVDIHDGKI